MKGDIIRVETPGAGGYGDPMKREPEKVLKDVIEKKVSVEAAKKDYGVVVVSDGVSLSGRRTGNQSPQRIRYGKT